MKQVKLLGGIGAILLLLTIIPGIGLLFGIAGLVLILIALAQLSNIVVEKRIFNYYLTSVVVSVAGSVASLTAVVGILVKKLSGIAMDTLPRFPVRRFYLGRDWSFEIRNADQFGKMFSFLKSNLWILIVIIAAIWIVFIVSSIFAKLSLDKISEKTENQNFKTAGLLLLIGAFLIPVFGLGFVVMYVGRIFEAIGFFSLKEKLELSANSQS